MTDTDASNASNASNAVAKFGDDGKAIIVRDPFAPETYHTDALSLVRSMHERQAMRREMFAALGDLADARLDEVKAVRDATEDDDDALLEFEKNLKDALLALSGFKPVVVQMRGTKARIDPDSVRGKFAEIIKACKARIDAEKPPKPKHTYCVRMTCDDDALAAVLKAAKKYGAEDVCYAAAQSDKAVRRIAAWFEENIAE